MIMHPYRVDLEGKDVTNTEDPAGKKLFQAFLATVEDASGGYVDYHWQWQDDPSRIFSKISYVQEYRPWHWIVGTGVYVEDVRTQIAAITKRMTFIFLGILWVVALLSVYVVWQGTTGETHRREIEESLRQSENKYRLMAETAREIILFFDSNLSITCANTAWKRISGYLPEELTEVILTDLIPMPQRSQFAARIEQIHGDRADDYILETNFIPQRQQDDRRGGDHRQDGARR